MSKFTPKQIENIREAIKMWETVPPENVAPGLRFWRHDGALRDSHKEAPNCGTVACFGGWCAWWPAFLAHGIEAWAGGIPRLGPLTSVATSLELFGKADMFNARDFNSMDRGMPARATDHAIVMNRLKKLLKRATA